VATIRKRNNKWQVQVRRAGQLATSKTFENRTDAAKWARQQEIAADKGELFVDRRELPKITLCDLVDRYFREVTPRKKSAIAEAVSGSRYLQEQSVHDHTVGVFEISGRETVINFGTWT